MLSRTLLRTRRAAATDGRRDLIFELKCVGVQMELDGYLAAAILVRLLYRLSVRPT
jgi:hypothetical protein